MRHPLYILVTEILTLHVLHSHTHTRMCACTSERMHTHTHKHKSPFSMETIFFLWHVSAYTASQTSISWVISTVNLQISQQTTIFINITMIRNGKFHEGIVSQSKKMRRPCVSSEVQCRVLWCLLILTGRDFVLGKSLLLSDMFSRALVELSIKVCAWKLRWQWRAWRTSNNSEPGRISSFSLPLKQFTKQSMGRHIWRSTSMSLSWCAHKGCYDGNIDMLRKL